jgi:TRAP-type C4-dicarboxylate transport system substrate-binding protein
MRVVPVRHRLGPMTRVAAIFASVLASAALFGCSIGGSERVGGKPPGETRVLTLLDPFANRGELTEFVDEVSRLSHGRLTIRVVPARDRGPAFEAHLIRDMRRGRADLAFAASRAWDEFGAHRLRALAAPFLVDSYRLEERVLSSELVDSMLDELRPLGLVGIGILPGPIRRPLGVRQPLASPSDFKGLTIGTQQSRVADAALRALGARPRRLPVDVSSLSGLDALEHRVAAIEAARLDAKGSHLMTNVNLWPRPLVLFASTRSYSELTAEERRILGTAAEKAVPRKIAAERGLETESVANLCRKGRAKFDSATPAELAALRHAVERVYRELEGDPGTRSAIEEIRRLKLELGAPADRLPDCGRAGGRRASRAATELDGVWRMETDRSASRPDYLDENWGDWIFVLDRGRFAFTQENSRACTWGYGTFAVDGNRMSQTVEDGGGIAPNDAVNRPGEYFVYDFSAYRDTLKLSPVEGEIGPLNFRAEPWRRLSDQPSSKYFSERCPPPDGALRR